jgi:ribonuclease VapC
MFVDASAIVAILTGEPEAAMLQATLEQATLPITSSIAVYEATLGVFRKRLGTVQESSQDVHDFLREAGIRLVAIAPDASDGALDAFARYGKGRGHKAQLNMGDCFAYAVAKAHGTSLLFKGEDFGLTDIAAAAPAPPSAH